MSTLAHRPFDYAPTYRKGMGGSQDLWLQVAAVVWLMALLWGLALWVPGQAVKAMDAQDAYYEEVHGR